jgi:hypothetical protein
MSTPTTHSTEMPFNSSTAEHSATGLSAGSSNVTDQNGASDNDQSNGRQKSEAEIAADKLYEERIEEEYAKREGGA